MAEIVIVGAVESTETGIRAAHRAPGWHVRAVVTLPPDMAARHSDFRDLGPICTEIGAQLIYASRINEPGIIDQIRALKADLLLVVGWSQICGPDFLNILPGKVLGYHPAALPRLRGRAAIPWTILLDEPITAGTLFRIDEGTDTGPIVAQCFFHVAQDETASSLYSKHMAVLEQLVADALPRIRQGLDGGEPQDERYATYGARRSPEDGRIDWSLPTTAIDRLIRAVGHPYPGAFTFRGEQRLVIWQAKPFPGFCQHAAAAGQIVGLTKEALHVRTIDGVLQITKWEIGDGKPLKLHQRFS